MNKKMELVKNTFIITIGKLCTQFISFFLLPLYTALLSTEEYGIVDLIQTYIQLLLPLIMLQVDQAVFRFLIDNREKNNEKKQIITTSMFFLIVQGLLSFTIFSVASQFISSDYKDLLILNILAMMFSNVFLQVLRGIGYNKEYSISSILCAAVNICFNILFVAYFKLGATGMLLSLFFSNVISAIYIFIKVRLYNYISIKSINILYLKKMMKYSIPLIPNALSWWIVNSSDRVIVVAYLGNSSNGILSIAYKFSMIYISFYNIFSMSWTESASLHKDEDDAEKYFSQIINTAFGIFSSVALLIISVMPFVFNNIINNNFKDAYYQIPILLFASMLNVIVGLYGSVYIAFKKTSEIAKTSIYAGILNIIINLILIRFIGLYAASISTVMAYAAMIIYRYIDLKKYIKIMWKKKNISIIALSFGIIMTLYYIESVMLHVIALLISIWCSIYINIDVIKRVLELLYSKFLKKEKR